MTSSTHDSGFTLVEILIAMFIFSLISVGTMSALTLTLRGQAQMNNKLEHISRIETARALIKSDMMNLTLRSVRDNYGGQEPYMFSGGLDTLVTFTRAGRWNPEGLEARSEYERVSYVFEDRKLIRQTLAQDNPAPQTEVKRRILLDGLAFADVKFRTGQQGQSNGLINVLPVEQIFVQSNQTQNLPRIITLELEFEDGSDLVQHFEVTL